MRRKLTRLKMGNQLNVIQGLKSFKTVIEILGRRLTGIWSFRETLYNTSNIFDFYTFKTIYDLVFKNLQMFKDRISGSLFCFQLF